VVRDFLIFFSNIYTKFVNCSWSVLKTTKILVVQVPAVVRDYFPGGWHHHDREGRPVFLLRLGQMDVKGIVRSIGEEGLTKLTLHICEEGLRLSEESSHRLNKPITTWSMLLDLGRPRPYFVRPFIFLYHDAKHTVVLL
jgi:hypothetical protein